jgi:fructokinase
MDDGTIVVAGEALVDLVPGDGDVLAAHLGGGPFNVARAIARQGGRAAFLGRLSTDHFGRRLGASLGEAGVDLSLSVSTPDPTTLAVASLDAAGAASYSFYIDGTSAPGLATAPDVSHAATLCVGTLGLLYDPTASTLEALVLSAPREQLIAVDPNIRPAAIRDERAYRARLSRIFGRADVIKASADDLAWLSPGTAPADALRTLLRPGALGFATLGADGAIVIQDDTTTHIPAPPVAVIDTIGAGDAFLATLLTHDLTDPRAAAQAAVAAASAACTVAGAG